MRVAVTGGTGFLGRHVVAGLTAAGHQVRVLARERDDSLGAEVVIGDVRDKAALSRLMEGAGALFHLAGKVSRDRRDAEALYELHVGGTRAALAAAEAARVPRIVYASTSGTIACSRDPRHVATERDPYPEEVAGRWPYYASKMEAERVALEEARARSLSLVCLNPSLLLGPGDLRRSSTDDVLKLLKGEVPAIPSGGVNFVDARDAAAAFVAALTRGTPGERYLIGAANWSLRTFFTRLGELAGVKAPTMGAPDLVTRLAAYATAPLFERLGRPAPLDPISIEMSQVFWYFDSAKAEAELGFAPRRPDETLKDTITDLRSREALA